MTDEKIKELINEVTTQTVIKLKKSGLMKEHNKPAFKKTEELLKNYNEFKAAIKNDPENTYRTKKLLDIMNAALESIKEDPYYSVIEMMYFEDKKRVEIAEFYDVDERTISRNKNRLVDKLKIILFSDNTIEELFL